MWTATDFALWMTAVDSVAATLAQAEGYLCQKHSLLEHFETWRQWLLDDYATRLGYPGGSSEIQRQVTGDRGRASEPEASRESPGGADAQYPGQDAGRAAGPDPAEQATASEPGGADSVGQAGEAPNATERPLRDPTDITAYERLHRAANRADTPEYP